ncbi:lipoyl(octanoyl) transferase LipB [Microbacterium sp. STN6]|uniref:lipoyl(octanoyl) transferase LipB n=1 Tax=Microbacterium sp. STN6 TaxID=2995588 RepID=UPI00226102F5|nr:lipoyl(octanoyl) transferase LipB [Microbacterium sp. STN6]MCX7522423.1 lipoyl(octanoyl) transferase LipB [Microbacterium sp. STN6]
MVDFVVTGLSANSVPYIEALEQQRALHAAVAEGRAPDTVMLLEHPSVYTAGRRTEDSERPRDGSPVIDVDRGGKITWHGPGQLVGYPILKLPEPVDVVGYVRLLERVLIDVLGEFGIAGTQVEGRSGVWITGKGPDRKIAAVGIRTARGVTMHGFALNCDNSLEPYENIVACGIADAVTTTMSVERGRPVSPWAVAPVLRRVFAKAWDAYTAGALVSAGQVAAAQAAPAQAATAQARAGQA